MNFQLVAVCLALLFAGAHASCYGRAVYRVRNSCTWNSRTHPTDYPQDAHFTPMCGTAHNARYSLFKRGGFSTPGLKLLAEEGKCYLLRKEIAYCQKRGNCASRGFFSFDCGSGDSGVCSHDGYFRVSSAYPYVSMASMVAPSPDWFVGISNVNLCRRNRRTGKFEWVRQYPERPASLNAYDAGTDSGPTFLSENQRTRPFERISVFDARDASNIFYNQQERVLNPLCQIQLERVR